MGKRGSDRGDTEKDRVGDTHIFPDKRPPMEIERARRMVERHDEATKRGEFKEQKTVKVRP